MPNRGPWLMAGCASSSWRTTTTPVKCCGLCWTWPGTRPTRRPTVPRASAWPPSSSPRSRSSTSACLASTGSSSRAASEPFREATPWSWWPSPGTDRCRTASAQGGWLRSARGQAGRPWHTRESAGRGRPTLDRDEVAHRAGKLQLRSAPSPACSPGTAALRFSRPATVNSAPRTADLALEQGTTPRCDDARCRSGGT
jgi:hypothetical protein